MKHKTTKFVTHLLKPISVLTNHQSNKELKQRIILMYHGISKKPQFNCVTESLFMDQICWLKEKYSVVSLFDLVESFKSPEKHKSNLASITFDDGYVNFAEFAVPILEKCDCHATVFVPTGKVGYFNDWDEGHNSFHKMPIMSYDQLRQLPKEFVEIGSHGISHKPLFRLPPNEIFQEIVNSRLEIEQKVGQPGRFFAFPFGPFEYNFNFYRNCMEFLESYHAACTGWWGRFNSLKDLYTLRRIGMWESDSFKDFIDKLEGKYDWLAVKEKIGRFYRFIPSLLRG